MRPLPFFTASAAASLLTVAAQALTISTVPIGDAGNPFDTRYDTSGIGAVGYDYYIGATEVTNAQYVEFLNAVATVDDPYGLFNPDMAADTRGGIVRNGSAGAYTYEVKAPDGDYIYDDKPVVRVSWYDAIRFANWLHNGQGNGDTETGAYTILGGAPEPTNGPSIQRNVGATWFLPSQHEWYKAAYYDAAAGVYYDYPTGTNSVPDNNLPSAESGNSANYNDGTLTTGNGNYPFTNAGAYTLSLSPYGTFDQGGNVSEWIEASFHSVFRVSAGGHYLQGASAMSAALYGGGTSPTSEGEAYGFRVATTLAPVDFAPADFDEDGDVDDADLDIWDAAYGATDLADADGDHDSDGGDFLLWQQQFTGDLSPHISAVAVPESGAAILGLVAGLAAAGRCCRKQI